MVTVENAENLVGAPAEVAERLRRAGTPGMVFLDTAGNGYHAAALSILTATPAGILDGSIHAPEDAACLRQALASMPHKELRADLGIPLGGLFGTVDFDGAFLFGQFERLLVFDHLKENWLDVGGFLEHHPQALTQSGAEPDPLRLPSFRPAFAPCISRDEYERMVRRAQDYIAAGDIYQVNIAHPFVADWREGTDAFPFYQELRWQSPAPYSAYLELGDRQVLSTSPESFLKMSGNCIRTCPIKGTRPRYRDEERDEKSAYDLLTSPKEVAELIMITDLERSDLGQVCTFGSVRVSELLKIERFKQVFHLVSTVNGQLREEIDHLAAFAACFPGGSITGAPKRRATEIIHELESGNRGLYTGAIGYLGANGESQFNIAIRTAIAEKDTISFHVGAGIVADSDPAAEFDETMHKAAGILAAAEAMNIAENEQPVVASPAEN